MKRLNENSFNATTVATALSPNADMIVIHGSRGD